MVIHPDYGLMRPSPSLRGSGLKFPDGSVVESENVSLPLYEGVD